MWASCDQDNSYHRLVLIRTQALMESSLHDGRLSLKNSIQEINSSIGWCSSCTIMDPLLEMIMNFGLHSMQSYSVGYVGCGSVGYVGYGIEYCLNQRYLKGFPASNPNHYSLDTATHMSDHPISLMY